MKGINMPIENGKKVSFEYVLSVDGEVVDHSPDGQSLEYTHGEKHIVPGLEKELEGLSVGDEKTVVVQPEEAYGFLNPDAFQEVPRDSLPTGTEPKAGMALQGATTTGSPFNAVIHEVKDEVVVLNLNHPLAGKTLTFNVKIVAVG